MKLVRIGGDFRDWDRLLALIRASFAYMHPRIDPPSSALQLTPAALRMKVETETAYVVTEGDRLLGCVFCRPEPPDWLYIGKLAVAPDAQGAGIGRMLLSAVEAWAVAQGFHGLRLETRIELEENHAVFARWGFVQTAAACHPGYHRPTFIEMRKSL